MLSALLLDDSQKIGVVLLVLALAFIWLGILLLFDGPLLAVGDLFLVGGLVLVIGRERIFDFFAQPKRLRSTACLASGVVLVLARQPIVGILMQSFGLFNLFGPFFPMVLNFLRLMPVVGPLLKLPPVAVVLDAIVGSGKGAGKDNDMVLGGLFTLALSSMLYNWTFPPAAPDLPAAVSSAAGSSDGGGSSMLWVAVLLMVALCVGALCAAYYYGFLDTHSSAESSSTAEAEGDLAPTDTPAPPIAAYEDFSAPPDAGGKEKSDEGQNIAEAVEFLKKMPLVGSFFSIPGVAAMVESDDAGNEGSPDALQHVPGDESALRDAASATGSQTSGVEDEDQQRQREMRAKLDRLSSLRGLKTEGEQSGSGGKGTPKKRAWPGSLTIDELQQDLRPLLDQDAGEQPKDAAATGAETEVADRRGQEVESAGIDAKGVRILADVLAQPPASLNSSSSKSSDDRRYAAQMLPAYQSLCSSDVHVQGIVSLLGVLQAQLLAGVHAAQEEADDSMGPAQTESQNDILGKLKRRMLAIMAATREPDPAQMKSEDRRKGTKGQKGKPTKAQAKREAAGAAAIQTRIKSLHRTLVALANTHTNADAETRIAGDHRDRRAESQRLAMAWADAPEHVPGGAVGAAEHGQLDDLQEKIWRADDQVDYLSVLREGFCPSSSSGSGGGTSSLPASAASRASETSADVDDFTGHLHVPVAWLARQRGGATSTSKGKNQDISERAPVDVHQDTKDISRDRVQINGITYAGSVHGYGGILTALTKAARRALKQSLGFGFNNRQVRLAFSTPEFRKAPSAAACSVLHLGVGEAELQAFGRRVLAECNRTHSGGLSYEALEALVRQPELSLLVPDSARASALMIQIDAGPFRAPTRSDAESTQNESESGWRWGLRAAVSTAIPFRLTDPSACVELGHVEATFSSRIALDVGAGVAGNIERAAEEQQTWQQQQQRDQVQKYCDQEVDLWTGEIALALHLTEE